MRVFFLATWLILLFGQLEAAPAIITPEQWGSRPQPLSERLRHTPRMLIIHHSGVQWKSGDDPFTKIRALQSWGQREKGWPDLPYHYLLAPSGQVFQGRDWHFRPDSNTEYELDGALNVELWGNFEEQRVTIEQLRALVGLLAYLSRLHGIHHICGHGDAAPGQTQCPGADVNRYLQSGLLRGWTDQILAGQLPDIQLLSPWFR